MKPGESASRLLGLDLLRCIAALSVFVYHFWFLGSVQTTPELAGMMRVDALRYGFLGVELFFMISGYVIFMSLQGHGVREFAVMRFIRLFPTFWVSVLLTAAVLHLTRPSGPTLGTVLANLTMEPSVFRAQNVDGVYWSLAVELEFYLLMAFIAICTTRERFLRIFAIALAVDLVQKALFYQGGPWRSIVLASPFLSYFGLGITAYLVHQRAARRTIALIFLLSLPGAIFATLDKTSFLSHFYLKMPISPLVTLGCMLGGFGALVLIPQVDAFIGPRLRRVIVFCGGVTYPLYLLHQEIGYSIFAIGHHRLGMTVPAATGLAALLTLLLSAALYAWFDKPVRQVLVRLWRRRARSPAAAAAGGPLGTGAVGAPGQ